MFTAHIPTLLHFVFISGHKRTINIDDVRKYTCPETEIVNEICKKLCTMLRDVIISTVHSKIYGDKAKKLKW